jgi:hypothetical protein
VSLQTYLLLRNPAFSNDAIVYFDPAHGDCALDLGSLSELRTLRMVFDSHRPEQLDSLLWLHEELKPPMGVSSKLEEICIRFLHSYSSLPHQEIWAKIGNLLGDSSRYPYLKVVQIDLPGFELYTTFLGNAEALEGRMDSLKPGVLRVTRG